MNKLDTAKRSQIVQCLVEGNSIRATCRMTGAAKGTVLMLLVDLGEACQAFHDRAVRVIDSPRLQFDEIWCFVNSKARNTKPSKRAMGNGDAWTWCALDAQTKLMVSWLVSDRSGDAAREFSCDVASRVVGEPHIATDGLRFYGKAIREAFGPNVNHGKVEKLFGYDPKAPAGRYSPAQCIGCRKVVESGSPNPKHLNYVVRRAGESDPPNGQPSLYQIDKRFQQEARQPAPCCGDSLRTLQFLPDSPDPARHPGDVSGIDFKGLGDCGHNCLAGRG